MDIETLFEVAEQRWLSNWQRGPGRSNWTSVQYRYQYCDNYPDAEALVASIQEAGV